MQFKTVLKPSTHQIVVEKSKFICHLFPVKSEAEAEAAVLAVQKEHYKATHNVPVYLVGDHYRYSDDGEPAGTAAAPVLGMLKNEGYDRICTVITRYFGGTKLGTGGLVRAYTSAVKEALLHAHVSRIRTYIHLTAVADYTFLGSAEHRLSAIRIACREEGFGGETGSDLHIAGKEYADRVGLSLYMTRDLLERVKTSLLDLTGGNVLFSKQEEVLLTEDYEIYSL